mgnify:CR=1 FL=1
MTPLNNGVFEFIIYDWLDRESTELRLTICLDKYLVIAPWRGNPLDCPSDEDWYGYTTLEWHINRAEEFEWFESVGYVSNGVYPPNKNILTQKEIDTIEEELVSYLRSVDEDDPSDICKFSY